MKTMFVLLVLALAVSACGAPSTPLAPATVSAPAVASTEVVPPTPTTVPTPAPTPLPAGWPVATLKIVSSLPMTGNEKNSGIAIGNAMQLRVDQANSQACGGKYGLSYEAWDDASAALGRWDPGVEKGNAKKAAADKSIIGYLGTWNSGAAKISIPILDAAGPMVMISPANTYPGLTKPGMGAPGEPGVFYPKGIRNYARVASSEDVQGSADANFMFTQLGVKSVYVLDDKTTYGTSIADVFVATAKALGMTVIGRASIDPQAADYVALMTKISTSNNGAAPDAIFAAIIYDSNAVQVLSDKVEVLGSNTVVKFMGTGEIETPALIDNAGGNVSQGVYASVAGLPFPDGLTAAGKQFVADYQAKYGADIDPWSIYGYESMNVLLKAIENVCAAGGDPTDRKQVRDAVFATKDFEGVLGTWSFDKNGDTSLTDMTIYQVKDGKFEVAGTAK